MAWEEGRLAAGGTAVVASTGNTGIAFAMMGRALGFATHVVMPTNVFAEIPKVLEAWAKVIESRERLSPLAACWTSELGGLNKFVHTWVYKDLAERDRVRAASRAPGSGWPAQSGVRQVRQENKLLVPASFSPVR